MPLTRTCPRCGTEVPDIGWEGLCPNCLIRVSLEAPEATVQADAPREKPGDRIGRYKLLQQIGEGGMGVVYMAEQEEPIRRRVALKVIKLGMDTKSVIARFEAERQALALMENPNIAKIFDAGATESGRPFFVMELVNGIPITQFCDEQRLPTKDRLDLFVEVCSAIQHAHQKGVIHRDIKPSNILVTLHGDKPVPKVIDFGVAKASQQPLTDKTLFTQFLQFIGTPAYISPEQASLSGLDIDTRSDIYSLGVLLYELLTGKTPFDAKTLVSAGLDEMRRKIREDEPPKPSRRLTQELIAVGVRRPKTSEKGESPTEEQIRVSSRRQVQLKELIGLVRGDLDWIVMKCLEKDRSRRYETANGLASDIKRHLNQEPVVACPPSTAYKVLKFVCRHRRTVVTGAVIATLLVIGAMVSTWEAVRAWRAEREQSRLLVAAETARANESIQREQAEASGQKAQEEARRSAQVESYTAKLFTDVVNAFSIQREKQLLLEVLDNATDNARNELKDQPLVAATMLSRIGEAYLGMENPKAEGLLKEALDLLKTVPDRGGILHSRTLYRYCMALREQGKSGMAENVLRDLIVSTPKPLPTETNALHRLAEFWSYLSEIQEEQGKLVEAETSLLEWQRLRKSAGEPWFFPGIPRIQERLGKLDAAETQWREYVRHARAQTKDFASWWVFDYVIFLRQRGRYDEVSDLLRELKQSQRDEHAPNSVWRASRQFRLGKSFAELAWDQYRAGENTKAVQAASEAEQLLRESIQLGMNETYFRMETLPDAKGLLGGALVIKAATDLSKAMNERLALLNEAEPLIKSQLDGSEYLPDADTNTMHQAMLRHNRLYAVWNELAPSAERAALSAQWQNRAAMWIDPTTPYNRAQELRQQRKFVEAEIVCRQILNQVRNEHTTNATPLLARSLCDLARVLDEQKKHEESVQLLRESLDVVERFQPPIPVFRERVLVELNGLMTLMGNNTQKAAGDFQALQELAKLAAAEAQRQACFENLRLINGAKEQWALENRREDNATPAPKELWGLSGYVRGGEPKCKAGGTYIIGPVKASAQCSVHGSKY